ncbi:MAG TPA: hypothetical protein RMH99_21125 [Sandaracinaceae bacterium LLY-WYZ-13_1]|nr:hypothetical protein [Sandaracinaceae bacterium LLY-WYZ-13_1]
MRLTFSTTISSAGTSFWSTVRRFSTACAGTTLRCRASAIASAASGRFGGSSTTVWK